MVRICCTVIHTSKYIDDGDSKGFFLTKLDGKQSLLVTPENNAFLSFGLNYFHSGLWARDYNKLYWEEQFGGQAWTTLWKEGFYKHAKEITSLIKTNSMGYDNEENILLDRSRFLPYMKQYMPAKLSMHLRPTAESFTDIFSDEFMQICAKKTQEQVAPFVNDPMIIGFAMANIPILTEGHAESVEKYLG